MTQHTQKKGEKLAHVIDVNMGYGHSRAAHALKDLSGGEVITANAYKGIPANQRDLWRHWRQAYETISRIQPIPIVGKAAFAIAEKLQEIPEFYPRRDLSHANFALRQIYHLIEKKKLGAHLVELLNKNPLPVICTHPIPAFSLEVHGYQGDIWCVPTDTDVARPWVAMDAQKSRIKYFCANGRLVERLKLYGVREKNLFLTGFPLPKSLIGGVKAKELKRDLTRRICNLDPQKIFIDRYKKSVAAELGLRACKFTSDNPLTISYAVGGAGAQQKIGAELLKSLKLKLKRKELRIILIAGTRKRVADYFITKAKNLGLGKLIGNQIQILFESDRAKYFDAFNNVMHQTDILWTKPSELAFYTALGIPIIMAPPLGCQEVFNAEWLTFVGGGIRQGDVRYTNEWLFDWLNSGGLARAAWNGYMEAQTFGTYLIEDILRGLEPELMPPPLIV